MEALRHQLERCDHPEGFIFLTNASETESADILDVLPELFSDKKVVVDFTTHDQCLPNSESYDWSSLDMQMKCFNNARHLSWASKTSFAVAHGVQALGNVCARCFFCFQVNKSVSTFCTLTKLVRATKFERSWDTSVCGELGGAKRLVGL